MDWGGWGRAIRSASLPLDTNLACLSTLIPIPPDPRGVPTRQTSSSGRPKSPRIQVVLPEELCQRLAALAEDESRTVSNMAKVLIQQGVERLERERTRSSASDGFRRNVTLARDTNARDEAIARLRVTWNPSAAWRWDGAVLWSDVNNGFDEFA